MLYLGLTIALILVIYIITTYNKLIKLRHIVEEAFSTMDVYLKKRWDLVPNLVEVVKGYVKHEKDILEKIVKLRVNTYQNMSTANKINVNNQLENDISKIILISEQYPELKANENFLRLSKELTQIEDDIANSRKYYNGSVRIFNTKIQVFPNNILAKIFGFKEENMFEITNEEKDNVKVVL